MFEGGPANLLIINDTYFVIVHYEPGGRDFASQLLSYITKHVFNCIR